MKNKDFWRLFKEAKPIHKWVILGACLNLLTIGCSLIAPEILGDIVQLMYDFREGTFTGESLKASLLPLCLTLAALYLGKSVLSYARAVIFSCSVSHYFNPVTRNRMSDKVRRLSIRYLDKMPVGQFVEQMTEDVSNAGSLETMADMITTGFVQLAAIVGMLFLEDWRLACLVVAFVPFSLLLSSKLADLSEQHFDKMFELSAKHQSVVEESYSNYQTVKAYNLEQNRIALQSKVNEELREVTRKADTMAANVQPVISFANHLSYIVIALAGAYLAVQGKVTVGTVVTVVLFSANIADPLDWIAADSSFLRRTRAAAKRLTAFFDTPEEEALAEHLPAELSGAIELSHVDFSYDPQVPLIRDLSLSVKPGQKVAIVGPTGAGKTTLVNLLMRFYEIQRGQILIDGIDIAKVSRDDVRSRFGMVLQDTWLFKGTIAENVAYGRPSATREEIERVCDEAYCDHFIRSYPKGYDTVIGDEDISLSGGQKQLLTIARALLCDRQFLILDEATSNVDTRTEVLIQKAMNRLMKGRTCFVIAHRLSTIVDADVILVMNHGSIVERGTHEELLAMKGFYYEMYHSQD